MEHFIEIVAFATVFFMVSLSSDRISRFFKKIHFPIITGLLITGIIAGPFVLKIIEPKAIKNLGFLNDISLAFIAFAAGAELFLKELRDNLKSIYINTIWQLLFIFFLSSLAVFFLSEYIPFMHDMPVSSRAAVAIMMGTIFVASSPSSAIAIIREMRAKGPFVRIAMGVTVVKDVLIVVLFAISLSVALNLVKGEDFSFLVILDIIIEMLLAFGLGYLLGFVLKYLMATKLHTNLKAIILLAIGFGVYQLAYLIHHLSSDFLPFAIHAEPLLICIVGSFIVTNYSNHRPEFQKIIHDAGPAIYVVFFTLTGASMSLDILSEVWVLALLLFSVRLIAMIISGIFGSATAKDPPLFGRISWMAYVTQAGVGIGLATVVAQDFPDWGVEFYTIILGVIVLNQLIGPPLFKIAIKRVGEAHLRHNISQGIRKAIIFGLEAQSIALANQLEKHGWKTKILTRRRPYEIEDIQNVNVQSIEYHTMEILQQVGCENAEAIVLMLSDEENYFLAEMIFENIGTKEVVVRLHDRNNFEKFHELGALIVEPSTAIVSLLDNIVRSPNATSLILGTDAEKEYMDIEVQDRSLEGVQLKYLRLPEDVLILSITRKKQVIISHGYTKLHLGDIVTLVGSRESLEDVSLKFNKD